MPRLAIPVALAGCLLAMPLGAVSVDSQGVAAASTPMTDISGIPAFIESRPTPEEFAQAFPDVWLVLPGDIVSRSFCSQYYRFIAKLDADGRIKGGSLE